MSRQHSLRQVIERAVAVLTAAGIDSPRTDAEFLAAHVAGTDRGRLSLIDVIGGDFIAQFEAVIDRRARRTPLQHIIGTAAFGPLSLRVGPGVFTPRPETEAILEWSQRQRPSRNSVVVDLCTGSGALAIALSLQWPDVRVIGVDDDAVALRYARENSECAQTATEFVLGDVTDPALLPELTGSVGLLVANPPYIPAAATLQPEVARHDPHHALFGGPDGMEVIGPIIALAARLLEPGGPIAVEHDDTTSQKTVELFCATGHFGDVTARNDLTGRPRFVTATRLAHKEEK